MNDCECYFDKAWWNTKITPSERRLLIFFYGQLGECLQGKDQQLFNAAHPAASTRQARDAAKAVSDKVRPLRKKLLEYRDLYQQEEYLLIEAVLDRKSQVTGQRQGYTLTITQAGKPASQAFAPSSAEAMDDTDIPIEPILLVRNVTPPHSISAERVKIYQQPSRIYHLDNVLYDYRKQLLDSQDQNIQDKIFRVIPELHWPTRDTQGDLSSYTVVGQPIEMLDYYLSNRVADRVIGKNVKKPVWSMFGNTRSSAIRLMACPMTLQVIISSKLSADPACFFVQRYETEGQWRYDTTAAGFLATGVAENASLWNPVTEIEDPRLSRYEHGLAHLNIRRAIQLTLCSILGVLKPDLRDGKQNFLAHAVDTHDGTHGLIFHMETDSDLSKSFLPQGSKTLVQLQIGPELDAFLHQNHRRSSPWLLLALNILKMKYE